MISRLTRWSGLVVAGLALASSVTGLRNGFVYDDVPIILQNPVVRHPGDIERIWSTPYWNSGLLYRPLTVQLFALEWGAGGGRRAVFHLVSVALMVLVAVLFWRLARRILPPAPALLASALFAVHPVHAESVANVVGQAELLATGLILLVVERYLAWRTAEGITLRQRLLLTLCTLLAVLSKETGYVIPLLLIAAEGFLTGPAPQLPRRLKAMAPLLVQQFGVIAAAVLVRIIVLGPTTGAGPAVAIKDLPAIDRITGMLAVVPEWLRLLFWPAHLQAEYGPPAIPVTAPFGAPHAAGLAIVLVAIAVLAIAWRRMPPLAFGIAWTAIALFPVSNLLTVTGVILAERTLFLPSAGAMIVAAALGAALAEGRPWRTRTRIAAAAACVAAVLAGVVRSAERQVVWKEQAGFIRRLERDAPTTYRAQLIASNYYSETNQSADAERAGARAYALFKGDPQVFEQYGQSLRRQGKCREAIPVLQDGVTRFPDRTIARSRLIECALQVGDTARALRVADEALALGQEEFSATARRLRPPGREPAPPSP